MNAIVDNGEILSAILCLQRTDDEMVRSMRNIQKELMGFKQLVLTELVALKQALLPEPPRVTEAPAPRLPEETGMSDSPAESGAPTGEALTSARIPLSASLPEESARAGQAIQDQPVLQHDQETTLPPAVKDLLPGSQPQL